MNTLVCTVAYPCRWTQVYKSKSCGRGCDFEKYPKKYVLKSEALLKDNLTVKFHSQLLTGLNTSNEKTCYRPTIIKLFISEIQCKRRLISFTSFHLFSNGRNSHYMRGGPSDVMKLMCSRKEMESQFT